MPYVLSSQRQRAKYKQEMDFHLKIALNIIKEAIYINFDELELYVVTPEDEDESLNSEDELLLTVCDILDRLEQKLFD
jgi:hypothetical protein